MNLFRNDTLLLACRIGAGLIIIRSLWAILFLDPVLREWGIPTIIVFLIAALFIILSYFRNNTSLMRCYGVASLSVAIEEICNKGILFHSLSSQGYSVRFIFGNHWLGYISSASLAVIFLINSSVVIGQIKHDRGSSGDTA